MSWRGRLDGITRAVLEHPFVQRLLAIIKLTDDAGGPLLAAALAFGTMFAVVPVLLLLSGVLGWLIADPVARAGLLNQLIAQMPPLADVFADSLEGAVAARGALSIVGLLGLVWGASTFYVSLDEVMRRIFGGPARGFVQRRLRGALAIVVLALVVLVTVLLSSLFALVETTVGQYVGWRFIGFGLALALMVGVVLVIYRFVPTEPPTLREALLPAMVAGAGIGLLTNLFSVLAPLMIGGLAGFGILATIFGAFVWLNLCFQVLLYGAAWARYRRDREAIAGGSLPGGT
jgi:YihY family inner membrane protein